MTENKGVFKCDAEFEDSSSLFELNSLFALNFHAECIPTSLCSSNSVSPSFRPDHSFTKNQTNLPMRNSLNVFIHLPVRTVHQSASCTRVCQENSVFQFQKVKGVLLPTQRGVGLRHVCARWWIGTWPRTAAAPSVGGRELQLCLTGLMRGSWRKPAGQLGGLASLLLTVQFI